MPCVRRTRRAVGRGGATGRNPLEDDEPTSPLKAHVNPRKNESHLAIGNDAPPPQPKKNLPQLVSHLSLGGTAAAVLGGPERRTHRC